jgi:aminopeptidase N
VPEGYKGIANGNLRAEKPGDKGYINYEWFVSYPINTYGVTFYMGKFINFNETYIGNKDSLAMDFYVLEQNLETAKKFYKQTKDIIQVYEKLYGEFPYKKDGVGMVEAPYTGMENQTAIAIGDEYGSYMRRNYVKIDYDYLLIHETAHEWWGNAVTMADMADAWISEGFATYSEHLFVEQKLGYDEYVKVCAENMLEVENIWPMVGPYNVNDNAFLGGDVYNKGAAMLHNFRCELNNDTLFFSAIKGYFSKFIYQPISSKDFIDYFNSATGKDYSDFFRKFLYDADLPVLHYKMSMNNDTLKFTYNWAHVGKNFTMPFGIMVNDYNSIRLEGTTDPQTFILPKVKSFFIPNEIRFEKNEFARNSFTYFWTEWEH